MKNFSILFLLLHMMITTSCSKENTNTDEPAPEAVKAIWILLLKELSILSQIVLRYMTIHIKRLASVLLQLYQTILQEAQVLFLAPLQKAHFFSGILICRANSHCEVAFSSDNKTYYSQYDDCENASPVLYNNGNINCTGIGNVNGNVSGSFTGTLVHVNPDCTYDFQTIKGTFKAKRVG